MDRKELVAKKLLRNNTHKCRFESMRRLRPCVCGIGRNSISSTAGGTQAVCKQ